MTVPKGLDSIDLCLVPDGGPDAAQSERLRRVINAKNELYFHRWRPQNETYLFGFRKHEQGNNAREIPLFDPLVAAKEAEIARLRAPAAHTYEIILADVSRLSVCPAAPLSNGHR